MHNNNSYYDFDSCTLTIKDFYVSVCGKIVFCENKKEDSFNGDALIDFMELDNGNR